MIIETRDGRRYDTDRDLSSAERHVLQKLLNWRDLAPSVEVFREKKRQAFAAGWNGSGPLQPGPIMTRIVAHLEVQLRQRLKGNG